MRRWARCLAALGALLLFFPGAPTLAQEAATGTLEGVVKDSKGSPVAQATVTAQGPEGPRTATTDAEGRFSVATLPAGSYTVTVEARGFATIVRKDVAVVPGKPTELPIQLGARKPRPVATPSETPDP